MTDGPPDTSPLPLLVTVADAFNRRIPTQRFLDTLAKVEQLPFNVIAETQPFRLVAFRALIRDYPDRDPASLWLHAYDVEVEVTPADPTSGDDMTTSPPIAVTGDVYPETLTS